MHREPQRTGWDFRGWAAGTVPRQENSRSELTWADRATRDQVPLSRAGWLTASAGRAPAGVPPLRRALIGRRGSLGVRRGREGQQIPPEAVLLEGKAFLVLWLDDSSQFYPRERVRGYRQDALSSRYLQS